MYVLLSVWKKPLTLDYWKNIFWPIFMSPFLSSELCTKMWNKSMWEQRRSAKNSKRNAEKSKCIKSGKNSPYLKSMHKYWITEETSLPFYSVHLKFLPASYVFLLLYFTVWNASIKSLQDYKISTKSSAICLQENWNISKFLK